MPARTELVFKPDRIGVLPAVGIGSVATGIADVEFVAEVGPGFQLGPGDAGIIDELPAGRLYKDGTILEDAKSRAVVELFKPAR